MVNKGFLFATSNRNIKSHVVESQIILLFWPCLSLAEKHHTINHVIIFNDSVSKFYQCSIRGFCRGISMFFSICLGKKNAEVIKFLGILKKYVSKNKIYFCSRKESNVSLNKKVIFVFHTIFKLDFIMHIIYCIIHICLCSHFILFCSLISASKKWNIETILIFSYPFNWQNKMNNK